MPNKEHDRIKNKLEGAGNYLTRRIVKYWSQNQHIQMQFDVRDAKPGDPEGMREGINVWGEVYDTVHWAHTPLGYRSRGFVWFFSFLAWYEDIKRKKENVICFWTNRAYPCMAAHRPIFWYILMPNCHHVN